MQKNDRQQGVVAEFWLFKFTYFKLAAPTAKGRLGPLTVSVSNLGGVLCFIGDLFGGETGFL